MQKYTIFRKPPKEKDRNLYDSARLFPGLKVDFVRVNLLSLENS